MIMIEIEHKVNEITDSNQIQCNSMIDSRDSYSNVSMLFSQYAKFSKES